MSINIISTPELLKELLSRFENSSIEIKISGLILFGSYPEAVTVPKFKLAAESHETKHFDNVDEAVDSLFNLSPHLRKMK